MPRKNVPVALALSLLMISAAAPPQPPPAPQTRPINVMVVLDASADMIEKVWISPRQSGEEEATPQARRKIDVAKEALASAVSQISKTTGFGELKMGLRVYGRYFSKEENNCLDTAQEIPVSALSEGTWKEKTTTMDANGQSPLDQAIAAAAKDFAGSGGRNNVLLIIASSADTCGGDPCETLAELMKKGVLQKTYIVSFGASTKAVEQIACLGTFVEVKEGSDIEPEIVRILKEASTASLATFDVVKDGKSINNLVTVTAYSDEEDVDKRVAMSPPVQAGKEVQVFPGSYYFLVEADAANLKLRKWQKLSVEPGQHQKQSINVSDGLIKVKVMKNGKDTTKQAVVQVYPHREEEEKRSAFSIIPPKVLKPVTGRLLATDKIAVAPGVYDVFIELTSPGKKETHWLKKVEVEPAKTVSKEIEISKGVVKLEVEKDGQEVGGQATMDIYLLSGKGPEGREEVSTELICNEEVELSPGAYDIRIKYLDEMDEREYTDWVKDVQVKAGETLSRKVVLGEGGKKGGK